MSLGQAAGSCPGGGRPAAPAWKPSRIAARPAPWARPATCSPTWARSAARDSWAVAINDRGQVVGSSDTAAGDLHAFLYSDGAMTDLGTLGGTNSWASGINDRGQVVG